MILLIIFLCFMLLTLVILNVFYTKIEEERAFSIGISLVIMSLIMMSIIYENNVVLSNQKLIQKLVSLSQLGN